MTEKCADYLISAVRYNTAGTHIDRVRYHADNGDSMGSATETTRQQVVDSLENGVTFVTIYRSPADSTKSLRSSKQSRGPRPAARRGSWRRRRVLSLDRQRSSRRRSSRACMRIAPAPDGDVEPVVRGRSPLAVGRRRVR